MITLIALRNFVLRPWRSLFLLLGYSLGVAVMIVLLSIGEALLAQARQERLVGGGQVTVLPEGIDVEVLKTGGLGGMFFSIDHARFIYRQLLAAPRLARWISAAAPQIDSKLLYMRLPNGQQVAVEAASSRPVIGKTTTSIVAGAILRSPNCAMTSTGSICRRRARGMTRHGGNGITSTCSPPITGAGHTCRSSLAVAFRQDRGVVKCW